MCLCPDGSLLLMTWPEGARVRAGEGKYGRLPLQLAVTRKTPAEVVLRLIEAYPAGVNARNAADGKTVLMAAVGASNADSTRLLVHRGAVS